MDETRHIFTWTIPRGDLVRAAALVILTCLMWCTLYNRWTVESWQTPLTYLSDPEKRDVIGFLAAFKAAGDGHVMPFEFTNVPELGAPQVANWDDFPIPEKPLIIFTGFLGKIVGLFAAANFAVMLAHVLAAVAFYAACRLLRASWIWAIAGSLVFAFARFAFAHGMHHLPVTYYWHVPLCLVVCEWLFRGDGLKLSERRFTFALIVAVITGVQNIYYTFLFVQLVLFAGLFQGCRRGWRQALPAVAVVGVTGAAFLVMNLNTIAYHLLNGQNPGAIERDYRWMEVYGLKLVDMVIPPPDHAFPPFAAWGANHMKEVLLAPGERPPSGYLGVLGLGALSWLVVVAWKRTMNRASLPLEALLVLWIILFACVGGINGILGTLGFQLFRASTRYSIFILSIVLMYAARRLSVVGFRNPNVPYVLAFFVVVMAWYDQTPPRITDQALEETESQVASDQHFTERMEAGLLPRAMVFQFPIMDFPESPAPGVGAYDHERPYLYTKNLRFSFGADKGRPAADWQHHLDGETMEQLIPQLEGMGFTAIYLNRNGFADKGEAIVTALKDMGYTDKIESDAGDLVCVFLRKR